MELQNSFIRTGLRCRAVRQRAVGHPPRVVFLDPERPAREGGRPIAPDLPLVYTGRPLQSIRKVVDASRPSNSPVSRPRSPPSPVPAAAVPGAPEGRFRQPPFLPGSPCIGGEPGKENRGWAAGRHPGPRSAPAPGQGQVFPGRSPEIFPLSTPFWYINLWRLRQNRAVVFRISSKVWEQKIPRFRVAPTKTGEPPGETGNQAARFRTSMAPLASGMA